MTDSTDWWCSCQSSNTRLARIRDERNAAIHDRRRPEDGAVRGGRCQPGRAVFRRPHRSVLRTFAPRGSGALLPPQPVRPLLVGDQVPRHQGGHQPRGVFLRARDHHRGRGRRLRDADVHCDGSAPARRAAQGSQPGGRSAKSQEARRHHPRAGRTDLGLIAEGRDLQLGGPRLDRADHPDAGHPVRFSIRGPAQAHALVGRRWHRPRSGGIRRRGY